MTTIDAPLCWRRWSEKRRDALNALHRAKTALADAPTQDPK